MAMSVGSIPQLTLPSRSEMDVGADRGVQLENPASVTDAGEEAELRVNFEHVLADMVGHAAQLGHTAQEKAVAFAEGRVDDLHGTMIAAKKAEISLQLVGNVRNKLLDAFHELWRISV